MEAGGRRSWWVPKASFSGSGAGISSTITNLPDARCITALVLPMDIDLYLSGEVEEVTVYPFGPSCTTYLV